MTKHSHIRPFPNRSFIAAYIGNIIGALFVALPAVYFYLSDYRAEANVADVDVEAGEGFGLSGSSGMGVGEVKGGSVRVEDGKRGD